MLQSVSPAATVYVRWADAGTVAAGAGAVGAVVDGSRSDWPTARTFASPRPFSGQR